MCRLRPDRRQTDPNPGGTGDLLAPSRRRPRIRLLAACLCPQLDDGERLWVSSSHQTLSHRAIGSWHMGARKRDRSRTKATHTVGRPICQTARCGTRAAWLLRPGQSLRRLLHCAPSRRGGVTRSPAAAHADAHSPLASRCVGLWTVTRDYASLLGGLTTCRNGLSVILMAPKRVERRWAELLTGDDVMAFSLLVRSRGQKNAGALTASAIWNPS